jgi:hypothetical protein
MKDKLLKTFIDEDLSDVEDYSPEDSRYLCRVNMFCPRERREHVSTFAIGV